MHPAEIIESDDQRRPDGREEVKRAEASFIDDTTSPTKPAIDGDCLFIAIVFVQVVGVFSNTWFVVVIVVCCDLIPSVFYSSCVVSIASILFVRCSFGRWHVASASVCVARYSLYSQRPLSTQDFLGFHIDMESLLASFVRVCCHCFVSLRASC